MRTKTADPVIRPLHVLTTYRAMTPSVRWFGTEQLRWLAKQKMIALRAIPEGRLRAADCRWADCVVLTRADTPFELWLAQKLKHMGRKLLYVLDDDLEQVPEGLGCSAYYRDPVVVRLGKAVRKSCDVLVTHSPLLEEYYGTGFEKVVRIEQPAMLAKTNPEQKEQSRRKDEDVVRIGFSGSEDRAADVQKILAAPLCELKKRYGNRVEIEFFGARPPLVDELKLSHIPYTASAERYYQVMAQREWDIGLAPLENTRFYQCKFYNKFVEYCTYGIAGAYADMPPYRGTVHDGQDGILCGESEWLDQLAMLVESPALRREIAQAARHRAQDFELNKVSQRFWESLGEPWTTYRAPDASLSTVLFHAARVGYTAFFIYQTLRRHGVRVFSLAWHRIERYKKGVRK